MTMLHHKGTLLKKMRWNMWVFFSPLEQPILSIKVTKKKPESQNHLGWETSKIIKKRGPINYMFLHFTNVYSTEWNSC